MILLARHVGFLSAAPRPKHKNAAHDGRSRWQVYQSAAGKEPPLPDVDDPGRHLTRYFFEAGPEPLTWQDVESWQRVTGTYLSSWEGRVLVKMGRAYVQERSAGIDPDRVPPWVPPRDKIDRSGVAAAIRAHFGSMKGKKPRRKDGIGTKSNPKGHRRKPRGAE